MKSKLLILLLLISAIIHAQDIHYSWARNLPLKGAFGTDNNIVFDNFDNMYFATTFIDSFEFNSTLHYAVEGNIVIAKYDVNANLHWLKVYGKNDHAAVVSSAIDSDGNLYITGSFDDTLILGNDTLIPEILEDAFLAKFDSSGNYLWSRRSKSYMCWGVKVKCDHSNNVILTGNIAAWADFGGWRMTMINPTDNASFITKLDSGGNVLWFKSGQSSYISDFGVTAQNEIIVCGRTTITTMNKWGNDSTGYIYFYGSGNSAIDGLTMKFDSTGMLQWRKTESGFGDVRAEGISVFDNGTYALSGTFYDSCIIAGQSVWADLYGENYTSFYDSSSHGIWLKHGIPTPSSADYYLRTLQAGDSLLTILLQGSNCTLDYGGMIFQPPTAYGEFKIGLCDTAGNYSPFLRDTMDDYNSGYVIYNIQKDHQGRLYFIGDLHGTIGFNSHDTLSAIDYFGNVFIAKIGDDIIDNTYSEKNQHPLIVYPNPSTGKISIDYPGIFNGNFEIQIFNSTGQLCYSKTSNEKNIDVSQLQEGIYLIRILFDKKVINQTKIIMERN